MAQRFQAAKKRLGLDMKLPALDLSQFKVPAKAGDQGELFES